MRLSASIIPYVCDSLGTLRSLQGAKGFLILKSLTSTASKAGTTAFDALLSLIFGRFGFGD